MNAPDGDGLEVADGVWAEHQDFVESDDALEARARHDCTHTLVKSDCKSERTGRYFCSILSQRLAVSG